MTDVDILVIEDASISTIEEEGEDTLVESIDGLIDSVDVPSDDVLTITEDETDLVSDVIQGPSGPGIETIVEVDASRPIAYVGYQKRILRLDYSALPPSKAIAQTLNLQTDWPNRAALSYSAI